MESYVFPLTKENCQNLATQSRILVLICAELARAGRCVGILQNAFF
jgi:hypothetical protein